MNITDKPTAIVIEWTPEEIHSSWCVSTTAGLGTALMETLHRTRPLPDKATPGHFKHLSHRPGDVHDVFWDFKKKVCWQTHFFPQCLCLDTEPQGQQIFTVGWVETITTPPPPDQLLICLHINRLTCKLRKTPNQYGLPGRIAFPQESDILLYRPHASIGIHWNNEYYQ